MAGTYAFLGTDAVGAFVDARLGAAGWERADSADAAVVVTHAFSQSMLEDAYLETEGIIATARKGAVCVDLSPTTPSFARELGAMATVSGLSYAEAPLVVRDINLPDALSAPGNVDILLAGEEDACEQARPVADLLSDHVSEVGGAGCAQLARAARTLREAAGLTATVEAYALFRAGEPFASSCGPQAYRQGFGEEAQPLVRALAGERFGGSYTIEMMMGELSAALMAADDVDLILPHAEACMHLLELMSVIGGMDMAPAALSLAYADEDACAQHGLDWSRAEGLYSDGHDHEGDLVVGAQGVFDDADDDWGEGEDPALGVYPGFGLN